jgi:hypothetical protein
LLFEKIAPPQRPDRDSPGRRASGKLPAHISRVNSPVLSLDTSPDIAERQMARWRTMTPAEKLDLVRGLNLFVLELEQAGIRQRHPGITEGQVFRLVAESRLGAELAAKIYGPRDVP